MVSLRSHLAKGLRIFAAVGFVLTASILRAVDTNSVLENWFAAQAKITSLSADFVQTRTLKTLVRPLTAKGHLWFAPSNQFRWELGNPPQTIAMRHGDDMYVIYPRLKRAEHYPLGASAPREWRDAMALLDAGFPRTRQEFEAQFEIQSLTQADGKWVLTLHPRQPGARQFMPELRVFLSTNYLLLAGTELVFVDGSSMRNDFTDTAVNTPVDAKNFQWQQPPDFKVTEPLSQ